MNVRVGYSWEENRVGIDQLARGRSNSAGDITLDTSSDTSTLLDNAIQVGDVAILVPLTANAASEMPFVYSTPATVKGSITLTHSNTALADLTFRYRITE